MTNQIVISGTTFAMSAAELGDRIASGEYEQVGVIRTQYESQLPNSGDVIVRGRSTQAVLVAEGISGYLAVENHRGVAIVDHIGDEEMIHAFDKVLAEDKLEPGEVFVYDQVVQEGIEMQEPGKGLDMSHIAINDGTDPDA